MSASSRINYRLPITFTVIHRIWPLSLAAIAITGLIVGGLLRWWHGDLLFWSTTALVSATITVIVALSVDVALSLRRGDIGLDLIAALSMSAALWFGEYFAGAIVAVMYAGGQFLESFAQGRAESGMSELLSRAPRSAVRVTASGLSEVPIAALAPGDKLLVRKGDVVPVDGKVVAGHALLNEAALTGEPLPARRESGELIMSGSSNLGDAFEMIASGSASESTYAGIIRMVSQARNSKAPISRLADRFSLAFLAMTLVIAGLAAWLSGDPTRIVAVLVVATPCPLILAVPVALVAGMSKAARAGVLVKGAHVLEVLATISVVVFDKTGTLTTGEPAVVRIETDRDAEEILRLAASVDQASGHVIGQTIVEEAKRRGLRLAKPAQLAEVPGEGIEGYVGGHKVAVGGWDFIAGKTRSATRPGPKDNSTVTAYVAIDDALAATIVMADPVRKDAVPAIADLRRLGVKRLSLATGDRAEVADAVGLALRLDQISAELEPAEKVQRVTAERSYGRVMMIGDGVNDAPALAAADVGVAVGRRNLAAAAEAADVVLLRDDLGQIGTLLQTARRSRAIALQSVACGVGLSVIAMVCASLGYLTPVQGALLQEVIDVAVIGNALRAL